MLGNQAEAASEPRQRDSTEAESRTQKEEQVQPSTASSALLIASPERPSLDSHTSRTYFLLINSKTILLIVP